MQKDYTKIDEMFDKEFYEGDRNSVHCKKHKIYATPFEIKNFIHTQISLSEQSLLERVEKEVDSMIESGHSMWDLREFLTSLKHLPQEEVKNK